MIANRNNVRPLDQEKRPKCSLPLHDADLSLDNANWTKGLQSMSDWIWSGNLNPRAFPNHLARYFLQIPGIFEQQLNFSTTLIFDEPSFKNGVQISGFVDRVSRELAISLIAQQRRCWYSMTHHAVLGRLTANKHGLTENEYADKWSNLTEFRKHMECYSRVERAVLEFADTFATNPKAYTDEQYQELRDAFMEDNQNRYAKEGLWQTQLEVARHARAKALFEQASAAEVDSASRKAADSVSAQMPRELNERKVDAQVVELAFLCMQFVALTCVFSGLNIPDEDFLADVMAGAVPSPVIERINEFNRLGLETEVPELVPGPVCDDPDLLSVDGKLFKAILSGDVVVEPAPLEGARIPLTPYEGKDERGNFRPAFAGMPDYDKGVTIGGVQTGVYGWSFGGHFPGGLVYVLMNHPELGRYEAPYSLPLLFNEDEWRNGVQTAGYVSSRIKELVIQKIYRIDRSRYGLEHHTFYFYNTFFEEHGVGRKPNPDLSAKQAEKARSMARERAEKAILFIHDHENALDRTFRPLEMEVMTWVECLLRKPHAAYKIEPRVRQELEKENQREIKACLQILDRSGKIGEEAAMKRLVDHQIAELAMIIGHMDGLARVLGILGAEVELPVQMVEGKRSPKGGFIPDLDDDGQVKFTGYFNNRPGFLELLRFIGVSDAVLTLNELLLNPEICKKVKSQLDQGEKKIKISAVEAAKTGEF